MNMAFLFNSGDELLGCCYGAPILDQILRSGVLQTCQRAKRFSWGDLLTFSRSKTYAEFEARSRNAVTPIGLDLRLTHRLEAVLGKETIYIVLFENVTMDVTEKLHHLLQALSYYLGAVQVEFSELKHLVYFRNSLVEVGRLTGRECALFYTMGEEADSRDISLNEKFESHGFSVRYEDRGARRTIFDDFDTPAHFQRIFFLRRTLTQVCDVPTQEVDDIIHSLEEVHPRLFDALAAAFKSWANAATNEDLAQAALSARRFLKLLTDTWFPGKSELKNGRKVTDHEVKNRFWAYLEDASETVVSEHSSIVRTLGKQFDDLWDRSSVMVHTNHQTNAEVRDLLLSIVRLTAQVVNVNPFKAAQMYGPYKERLIEFFKDFQNKDEKECS